MVGEKIWRHGDLLLTQITEDVYNTYMQKFDPRANLVIAYGEATGHHHQLNAGKGTAQVLIDPTTQEAQAFSVDQETELVHEEHNTLNIPKGYYRVEFEKEYEPLEQAERQAYD